MLQHKEGREEKERKTEGWRDTKGLEVSVLHLGRQTKPLKSNPGGFFRATGSLTLRTSTYGVTGSSCSPKEKAETNTQELSRNYKLVGTWGLLGVA